MTRAESILEVRPASIVPAITPEDLARRNQAAIALIKNWANDVDSDQDQRETMEVLRQALGADRIASYRPSVL